MKSHSDVVIVGGGIVGSSIAYQLASRGSSVTVIERDSIGNHASGYALGLLNPTNETGNIESLNHQSFKMHKELLGTVQEESGVDAQVLTMPHLELALEESELPELKKEVDRINAFSEFKSTWLEPEEIRRLEPRISDDIRGGVLVEDIIMLGQLQPDARDRSGGRGTGSRVCFKRSNRNHLRKKSCSWSTGRR